MARRSGQATVATAGTAVQLGTSLDNAAGPLAIKALEGNTGKVYIGNDGAGDVAANNGYELSAGDQIMLANIGGLDQLWVDASDDNQVVCWLVLGRMD